MTLKILRNLLHHIAVASDGGNLLGPSLDTLLDTLDATCAVAYRYTNDSLSAIVSRDRREKASLPNVIPTDESLLTLLDGRARFFSRDTDLPQSVQCPFVGIAAWLSIPLTAKNTCSGVTLVGWESDPATLVDLEFWEIAGNVLGLGIENARLYDEMQNRSRQSTALHNVSQALASTLDLDALLSLIVHSATENIPNAQDGVLHLLDESTGELHPRAHTWSVEDSSPDFRGRSNMRKGRGIAGTAMELGKAVNVPDVLQDERFIRGGSRPVASMLVTPESSCSTITRSEHSR